MAHKKALVLALAAAWSGWGVAGAADDTVVTLGEVAVRGSGELRTKEVLSSVNVLGSDQIENQNVKANWQLFNLMPGVMMTEFGMGTTSGKLSFRGFNGEGEVNAVKLLIDGIPSNTNDGNMPYLDMLFPLEIQGVEMVKGTNDPRYGLHNIAGNTNILTDQGGNYTKARMTYGSFDTREVQIGKGTEQDGFTQNYFIGYQGREGYRAHSDMEKLSVSGKWFYTPNAGVTNIGLIARVAQQDAQEAGYLTRTQAADNPKMSPDINSTDKGERKMHQISLHLDHQFSDKLTGNAKAYLNDIDDRRWVRFGTGYSQQERAIQETHQGVIGTMTYRPQFASLYDFAVEGGVNAEAQQNKTQRYNTTQLVRTAQTRDQSFDIDNQGAYLQAVIKPVADLKLIPAYRVDQFSGNLTNKLTGKAYDMNDYGLIKQPKFSAVYTVVPNYNLYGNVGRSFQIGLGAGAYKVGQTADLAPSINDGWEFGLKSKPIQGMDARIAMWQQTASNEMRRKLNDPSNANEAIGKTRRNGVDAEVSWKVSNKTRLWIFASHQDSKILLPGANEPTALGKEVDHVPHNIISAGIEHNITADLRLGATLNSQSDYYVERTNVTEKFGAYTLLNLSANYRLNSTTSLDFQIRNATNQHYEYVWYDSTQAQKTFHSPGDGRGFFASINMRY